MNSAFQSRALRKRNVLVIGGAGYIGSPLVRRLLLKGFKVKVLDNLLYANGSSIVDLLEEPNFSFIHGDFCNDKILKESLTETTDVVLLAALVGDPICKKYPILAKQINEEGTIKLFDLLSDRQTDRFVFTSTCSNYGLADSNGYATEETELNPQSLYAETKVNAEQYIIRNADKVNLCPTILRLSTAFGLSKRMRFDLTVSEFTREITLGNDLLVYDEDTWRPYCHVEDISESIIRVLDSPAEKVRGEIFNVGDNKNNYTKKMIVELVLKSAGEGQVQYCKGGGDRRNYRVSFNKINTRLAFRTLFTIEDSIRTLIKAIRNDLFDDVESREEFYGNYSIKEA